VEDDGSIAPRAASAAQTLAAIAPLLAHYDIFGIADHTPPGLTHIHATEVFRGAPTSGYLNLGKGFGREAALASGYMEAIEMCIVERAPEIALVAPDAVAASARVYDAGSRRIKAVAHAAGAARPARRWLVPGVDLLDGSDVFAWHDDLYLATPGANPRLSSTTGLASGNTLAEARLHAVYELVERHLGFAAAHDRTLVRRVELEEPPARLGACLVELHAAGFEVDVFDLGGLYGVKVFQCAVTSSPGRDNPSGQVNFGWGAHHGAAIAIARAVSEAVQGYATRRACRLGAIPPSRRRGGALITAAQLAGLAAPVFPGEAAAATLLREAPCISLRLAGATVPQHAEVALAAIIARMHVASAPPLLSWTLSAIDRPFQVVKCAIPGFDSFVS
jgi:ribosomal protein S12 methylthiotransferase accessory factor